MKQRKKENNGGMKTIVISLLFSILGAFHFIGSASAAQYFDQQTKLLFQFSDEQQAIEKKEASRTSIVISKKDQLNTPLFEISTIPPSTKKIPASDQSLSRLTEIIDNLKLRVISVDNISNRPVLGTSAIELQGKSLETSNPLRIILLPLNTKDVEYVEIRYFENDLKDYEDFLSLIRKGQGLPDTVTHPLHEEIGIVLEKGIFKGYPDKDSKGMLFKPEKTINRAELLKVLVLSSSGVNEAYVSEYVKKLPNPFPDVDSKAWFAPFIIFAQKQGWVKGYPNGTFQPGNDVNLAEAMKIILIANTISPGEDKDVWFRPYLQNLIEKNILVSERDQFRFSFTSELLRPTAPATRAHIAGMLARISALREGKIKDRYLRSVNGDQVPFELPSVLQFAVVEEGKKEGKENTYEIFQGKEGGLSFVMRIAVFDPALFSDLPSNPYAMPGKNVYLGENKSRVFIWNPKCYGPMACADPPVSREIERSFKLKKQDLKTYTNANLDFEFLYSDEYQFAPSVEGDRQNLSITLSNGAPLLTLTLLSGFQSEAEHFEGRTPTQSQEIGNRTWHLYEKNTKAENRIDFITSFSEKLMAVTFTESGKTKESLMPKVLRILRSLR